MLGTEDHRKDVDFILNEKRSLEGLKREVVRSELDFYISSLPPGWRMILAGGARRLGDHVRGQCDSAVDEEVKGEQGRLGPGCGWKVSPAGSLTQRAG